MKEALTKLLEAIIKYLEKIPKKEIYNDVLYKVAFSFIGKDASPDDLAVDRLGCAESVSQIMRTAFPELHFPLVLSTREMFLYLTRSPSFKETNKPTKASLMIAVTGTGNGKVSNGHVAIVGKNLHPDGSPWAMSNNSTTGTWEANYSVNSFTRHFQGKGGMPVHFFDRV